MPVGEGPTAWHFANQIVNAVAIAKQHPNLFLLCVSNFSCTIDAFTHSMLASEMGAKPYLILEIDAHTADAGVQTRLEAFLDIIHNYRQAEPARGVPSDPAGSRGGPGDPFQWRAGAADRPARQDLLPQLLAVPHRGLRAGHRLAGSSRGGRDAARRSQLERGLQFTSGRECLPLPICLGQLLDIHEHRRPAKSWGSTCCRAVRRA